MQTPLPAEVENEELTETATSATATSATATREEVRHDTVLSPDYLPTPLREEKARLTFVLRTHDGDGYVLPCLTWEASPQAKLQTTKLQIEQIYKLRGREKLAEAVKNGNFSLLSENGDIILPTFWDSVINASAIVQVNLPSYVLDPDIASSDQHEGRTRTRRRPSSSSATTSSVANPESISESTDSDSSGSDEDSGIEISSSESELSESPALTEASAEVIRLAIAPVDGEGNNLSFQINTVFIGPLDRTTINIDNQPNKREPRQPTADTEHLDIAKAVSTQAENRNILQLHVLPGPKSSLTQPDISLRWYHLHAERLDFVRFRETCLGIPDLSERLHKLTRKLFERVEKDKLKAFLDGMFLEPGTVLRADESHQSDPQSVTFSCLPYFDLQTPVQKPSTSGRTDRLFPPRTLMQSYYPYEPVRERDAEQAYRKFGNEQTNALVHVPNLWIVNIGSGVVVTHGHQALSKDFVQSIEVVHVDCSLTRKEESFASTIRLTDWDGRKLLYSRDECRTYFQLEQELRKLRWCTSRSIVKKGLQLFWQTSDSRVKVTPGLWAGILSRRDTLFIDLGLLDSLDKGDKSATIAGSPSLIALSPSPFFHWPQTAGTDNLRADGLISTDIKRSIECLEHVEKAMLSEVLSNYSSYNAVEKTFTSTAYYRALPEASAEQVKTSIESLATSDEKFSTSGGISHTTHQALVLQQLETIAQKTSELYNHMLGTFALFVADVDKSTVLRKSWGALESVCDIAATFHRRLPLSPNADEYTDTDWRHPSMTHRGWFIRPAISDTQTSDSAKKLRRTFEKCRKCRRTEMYSTPQAAISHLEKHLKQTDASKLGVLLSKEWIVNYDQMKLETWNVGHIAILTTACEIADRLFVQAKELSEGVCNEDGQMSELYTFPRPLLSAFRQLLVFYFAVERAIYYTDDSFRAETNAFEEPEYITALPFSPGGLQVIEAFGNGVQHAMASARSELCSMVKSTTPVDVFSRLSLSSGYVSSWFMRRLIVKPLEKSMTISDMYREYLSTIQFQVNHRPGKRLLRSINLLQEELTALREVNTQQMKLISNYMSVLDDATYEKDIPNRRAMYPYERMLLASCQDSLQLTDQEYRYLLARCGPLSDSTKQSLEITEEDHGKAIMVFTIVTIIFLPLSFVTSFLGMNTTDIRDMGSSSSLFWAIAVPLTAVTMGSILYIGYNGDELRDMFNSLYCAITGQQDRSLSARGISVAQRKHARKKAADSNSTLDFNSLADEAEFANPRPDDYHKTTYQAEVPYYDEDYVRRPPRRQYTLEPPTMKWEPYVTAPNPFAPEPRTNLRTQNYMSQSYTRPEVQTYNEPITMKVHRAEASYPPPPPPQHTSPLPSPVPMRPSAFGRPTSAQDYAMAEPVRLHRSRRSAYQQPERAPAQYEWTKKSHRHHRSDREGIRRKRTGRGDTWDDPDHEEWYQSRLI